VVAEKRREHSRRQLFASRSQRRLRAAQSALAIQSSFRGFKARRVAEVSRAWYPRSPSVRASVRLSWHCVDSGTVWHVWRSGSGNVHLAMCALLATTQLQT
jgi:hypothetical protein